MRRLAPVGDSARRRWAPAPGLAPRPIRVRLGIWVWSNADARGPQVPRGRGPSGLADAEPVGRGNDTRTPKGKRGAQWRYASHVGEKTI